MFCVPASSRGEMIRLMEALSKLVLCFLFSAVLLKGCIMVAERDRILSSLLVVSLALWWAELLSSY